MTEHTILSILVGTVVSIGVVFWLMFTTFIWAMFSPLVALILIAGPILGYLSTKPEWVNKFWKQKEYRE